MDPWTKGRELAGGVLWYPPNLNKTSIFSFLDGWRSFGLGFEHTSGQLLFYHTCGHLPPNDTGRGVKTVTLGCIGAPYERTLFIIPDAVFFCSKRAHRKRVLKYYGGYL